MKNINRIAFFNFLSIVLLQGISFISSPLFSRLLGTDGYGNLSSFNIWAGVLCTVLSLQTNITIPNARVEFPEGEQKAYQSSVMALSVLAFAIGGVITMALIGPISAMLQMSRALIALLFAQAFGSFCINFLSSKFTYEFQADKNMLLSVFVAVTTMGVALLFVLNMPMEQRYFGRVLGNALVYNLIGIVACVWILAKGRKFYNRKYWRFCIVLAWPLVCQNLSYYVLGNSDILMLKQLAGASESGIYSLAFTMAGIIFTIFGALNNSWVPFFFDDMKDGRRENAANQAAHFQELFTVLSVGFVLLVREVWMIYASEEYRPGIELIPVFVGSYYLNFLCTFPVNFEYFHKKTGVTAAATIASAIINVGLNYVFILKFGMLGAAVATLLSHVIQLVMHEVYSRVLYHGAEYPFSFACGAKYTGIFALSVVVFYAFPQLWWLRWGLGAAIGLWELWRMWQRKGLL